jgi:hypothetical protein
MAENHPALSADIGQPQTSQQLRERGREVGLVVVGAR